ncbi:hypothetical protein Tco_0039594 [Tanacetum coccineum]
MCATNGVPTQGLGRSIVSGEYGNCVWDDDGRGTPVILDFRNSAFNTMYGQTSGGVCYSGSEIGRGQMVLDFENSVVRLPGYENRFVQCEAAMKVSMLWGYGGMCGGDGVLKAKSSRVLGGKGSSDVHGLLILRYELSLKLFENEYVPLVDGVLDGALGAFGDLGFCFGDEVLVSSPRWDRRIDKGNRDDDRDHTEKQKNSV